MLNKSHTNKTTNKNNNNEEDNYKDGKRRLEEIKKELLNFYNENKDIKLSESNNINQKQPLPYNQLVDIYALQALKISEQPNDLNKIFKD